jgi:hypothetical protein
MDNQYTNSVSLNEMEMVVDSDLDRINKLFTIAINNNYLNILPDLISMGANKFTYAISHCFDNANLPMLIILIESGYINITKETYDYILDNKMGDFALYLLKHYRNKIL